MNPTELNQILRDHGLRATATRLQVLSVLTSSAKAVSYSHMQKSLAAFDRVTLYRTIHAMIENGIIHKAIADESETYYALCSHQCSQESHDHQHIHFRCTSCDQVSCVHPSNDIHVSVPGHLVESFQIEVTGRCASCNV
jgi:Fur family ferric uptake transcriptional regulator